MLYNPINTINLSETQLEPSYMPHREIFTSSKLGTLKTIKFLDFKTFFTTWHSLYVLSNIVIESKPIYFTKSMTKPKWRALIGCEFDALMAY